MLYLFNRFGLVDVFDPGVENGLYFKLAIMGTWEYAYDSKLKEWFDTDWQLYIGEIPNTVKMDLLLELQA